MSDNEFTFAGQKVEKITLAIGLTMIIWGGVVTIEIGRASCRERV